MKYQEVLGKNRRALQVQVTEGKLYQIDWGYTQPVLVIRNPSPPQARGLVARIRKKRDEVYLRGLMIEDKIVLIWDGWDMTHDDVREQLFPNVRSHSSDLTLFEIDSDGDFGLVQAGDYDPERSPFVRNAMAAVKAGATPLAETFMVETEINFIDPAVKYADSAKAWSFRRVGSLDGLAIVHTAIPSRIAQGVREFFVIDGKRPVATIFLSPWNQPKGMQVRYAAVTPSYRSQGIGRRLYVWLLAKGTTLVSDNERSADGTAVWRWLARQPQISVTAFETNPEDEEGDFQEHAVTDAMWADPDAWTFVARGR